MMPGTPHRMPLDPQASESPPPPPDDQTPWGMMPGPATSDRTLLKILRWDAIKRRFQKRVSDDASKATTATSQAVSASAKSVASSTETTARSIRDYARNAFDTVAAKIQKWRDTRDDIE